MAWGSGMDPADCTVCPECGTTLLKTLDGEFVPPGEHDLVTKYDQNTGKPYKLCRKCMKTFKNKGADDGEAVHS